jgi:ubiquinone biosynthesis protein UbiJ
MFPGPTLRSAVSAITERALNQALRFDPAGRKALQEALTGPVQFELTQPLPLTLTLQSVGERITVTSGPVEQPALVLSGSPLAFASLAGGDQDVFSQQRIRVTGDTGLAHQFQRALNQLNPDWESALAGYTGDLPAHFIGQRIRGMLRWSHQAITSMTTNIEEYIHEESGALPGGRELEATFDDIDELNLRTERLEARVRLLESKNDSPEPP